MIDKLGHSESTQTPGFKVKTQSTIPTGCGMGSSAATITSTNYALSHFFLQKLSQDQYYQLGQNAENLQHGRSSGLDIQAVMQGGLLKFKQNTLIKLPFNTDIPMWVVNTGTRLTSAGECLARAKSHFEQSEKLLHNFSHVTSLIEQHLASGAIPELKEAFRENHRLLVEIGVVPEKIQLFVQMLEGEGAAAKISGAGGIKGDRAGIVLIIHEHPPIEIVKSFGFELEEIKIAHKGVEIVEQQHADSKQHTVIA